jgi:hypothetical protein
MWFLNLKALLDATLTLLTATGAIAVDLWDQSRSGQGTSKPLPHLGGYCYPLKVARNHPVSQMNNNHNSGIDPFTHYFGREVGGFQFLCQ